MAWEVALALRRMAKGRRADVGDERSSTLTELLFAQGAQVWTTSHDGAWTPDGDPAAAVGSVSVWTVAGLIMVVLALCAVLSGVLAPEGGALALLGLCSCAAGRFAAGRPGKSGGGVALLGAVIGAGALVLAVLAVSGRVPWPNSHTDEVLRWQAWLAVHWPTVRRWV